MEIHVFQTEELDASPKIAPYDWNPVAEEWRNHLDAQPCRATLIDQKERHYHMWIKVWNGNLILSYLYPTGNTGWPKLAGSD